MRLRCSIWSISVFVMLAGLGWFLHPLSANAQEITTVAGDGTQGFLDGTGTSAKFNRPNAVAVQGDSLFVADKQNNRIRKIILSTGEVTTVAGDGTDGFLDGVGTSAQFSFPVGVAVQGDNLFVSDFNNHRIRKIILSTGEVTTVAGSGTSGFADGTGTTAQFSFPAGVAVQGDNLFVADRNNHRIRKIILSTGEVTTVAGSGTSGFADGTGTSAQFSFPAGVAVQGDILFVADQFNDRIRKIILSTGEVTTVAGSGTFGFLDGTGTSAQFAFPAGVAVQGDILFVTDINNHRIRKIILSTGEVTTVAGSSTFGFLDGTGTSAQFAFPAGVAVQGDNLFVADQGNNRIRKINLALPTPAIAITPASASFGDVVLGSSATDSVVVKNTGTATLSVSAATVTGADAGLFTVTPSALTLAAGDSAYVRIVFAPTTDGNFSATLTLTHNAPGSPSHVALTGTGTAPVIEVSPTALSMGPVSPGVVRLDSVKVKNTGTVEDEVHSIAASGADAGLFTVTPSALVLAGGDSAYVRIVFAPTTDGNFSTTLTLTHFGAGSPSHVALTGTGTAPVIEVSPTALSMGPVPSDLSAVDSVKVKNTGTLALGVSSIAVTGTDAARFAVTPSSLTVPPSDSAYVKIEFTPTIVGNFSASLTLVHNAGGPVQVPLTGTSVVPVPEVKLVFKDNFGMRGEQLRVPIFLENNDSIAVNGLQFDVALPDSILTFVGVTDSLGDKGFSVSAQLNPDRIIVVVFTVSEGILLESTEIGALVYDVKPVLSNQIRGESIPIIQVSPHNTEVVDTLTNQVITHTVTGNYTIGIRGDANHDGTVSIIDAVTTVRVILGKESPPLPAAGTFQFARHDGTGDGTINIVDVIYQINRILGRPVDQPLSKVVYSPVTVDLNQPMASGAALYLPVTIETDTPIGGLQLAYAYDPSLVTVGEPRMAVPSDDVTLEWYAKDGILRVIAYSISGEAIVLGRSALMIPVTVPEGRTPEITLTEAVLSDPSGRDVPVRLGQTRVAVAAAPTSFSLAVARPNPFNPSTTIAYEVPEQTHITLTIYNLLGQEVVRLVDQAQAAGRYETVWQGVNSRGAGVASGVYLYRIVSGSGYTDTKRMTLLK